MRKIGMINIFYILIVFELKQYANFSKTEKQYVSFSNGIPKICAFHYILALKIKY